MVGAPLWDLHQLIKEFSPKDIGVAFDIHHAMVEGGLSWQVQFKLLESHLGAVYVKDFKWQDGKVQEVPLGQGRVDAKFFSMLKQSSFKGPISLHVEYLDHSQDREVITAAFKRDLATLKSWL